MRHLKAVLTIQLGVAADLRQRVMFGRVHLGLIYTLDWDRLEPPTPAPEALLVAAVEPRLAAVLPAPDDMKRAEVIIYDCAAIGDDPNPRSLEILRIVDPAAATEYQIDSQFINCGGLGAFGLERLAVPHGRP